MTLAETRQQFTRSVGQLLTWATAQGYEVALDTARRSLQEQRRLVDSGASRTLRSQHVKGLAIDLLLYRGRTYVTDGAAYQPLGAYWRTLDPHHVWGGDWATFRDYGHFEYAT